MNKNQLLLMAILGLATVTLSGCYFGKEVNYDLTNEMGRQLHCLDKFGKEIKADSYGAEMSPEVNNGFSAIVEGTVKVNDDEYHLVCTYADDLSDWTMDYTLLVSNQFDLETELGRIEACADRVGFYLNTNNYDISREEESEGGALFVRNGHVVYTKQGENAEDDVECMIDMVDGSVNIEFSNHIYNGELQVDTTEPIDQPVTKMRVLEGETKEETQARVDEACANMGGEGIDGVCTLEDGITIAF